MMRGKNNDSSCVYCSCGLQIESVGARVFRQAWEASNNVQINAHFVRRALRP